ncbi:MAG: acyclic terpene utilization AtuA family protein [Thermoanaerobaculia bacterium]
MTRVVRIANAGGYWGDDPDALRLQVEGGPIDYLAEITMVILEKLKAKDSSKGYATDFVRAASEILPQLLEKKIRLVTNAGGVHPEACAEALLRQADLLGLSPRIAVVRGAAIDAARWSPAHLDSGAPFDALPGRLESAYAYLGARPIAEALARGADIVITGRVADASLTLGPLVHEFGWGWDDWNLLACGTIAGHILECGAQATGGNLTDWSLVPNLADVGYPIAEVSADGAVVITKHPGTGGAVTRESVVEQLLYEIGDPRAYATPDVTVDLTRISVTESGPDRVRFEGARGIAPPATLKAGLSYHAGWKSAGTFAFGPPSALAKAQAMEEIFWTRLGREFDEVSSETQGWTEPEGRGEVFLRVAVRDRIQKRVEAFSRRFASFALSGPAGVSIPGGKPAVQEVFGFWPGAVPRDAVSPVVWIGGERVEVSPLAPGSRELPSVESRVRVSEGARASGEPVARVPLFTLAYARSGDKGDTANIGVAARSEDAFRLLASALTEEFVRNVFANECRGPVLRFEIPGLRAFNFVLRQALGGGGMISLRSDPQGKLFAQRLLAAEIEIPEG